MECQYIDGWVQDCSVFSALAMEIVQSSTKPTISPSCLGILITLCHIAVDLCQCLLWPLSQICTIDTNHYRTRQYFGSSWLFPIFYQAFLSGICYVKLMINIDFSTIFWSVPSHIFYLNIYFLATNNEQRIQHIPLWPPCLWQDPTDSGAACLSVCSTRVQWVLWPAANPAWNSAGVRLWPWPTPHMIEIGPKP